MSVSDRGSGIPHADLNSIFERFYREDAASVTGGLGLWLAIAKRAVSSAGTTIAAVNRSGKRLQVVLELALADLNDIEEQDMIFVFRASAPDKRGSPQNGSPE